MMIYGYIERTPQQIIADENRRFEYLEAIIKADKLNPDEDYDNDRLIDFLKQIAISDLPDLRRRQLVNLLNIDTNEE